MIFLLQLVHISKNIRNFAVEKVMMSENKRNLTEKEEYYKLITDEKSNHIGTNANGAGSQCVRRKNREPLLPREIPLSPLRKRNYSDFLDSYVIFMLRYSQIYPQKYPQKLISVFVVSQKAYK